MQLIISILLAIMPVHAQDDTGADACDAWGTIAQADDIVDSVRAGDAETLLNVANPSCGDVSLCKWELQGGHTQQTPGTLYACGDAQNAAQEAYGGSICYMPPDGLYDCVPFEFQVKLTCQADDDGVEPGSDSVRGELNDLTPECTVNASVTGGGCISAQGSGVVTASVWLLFPFFGMGAWMRRRDD